MPVFSVFKSVTLLEKKKKKKIIYLAYNCFYLLKTHLLPKPMCQWSSASLNPNTLATHTSSLLLTTY